MAGQADYNTAAVIDLCSSPESSPTRACTPVTLSDFKQDENEKVALDELNRKRPRTNQREIQTQPAVVFLNSDPSDHCLVTEGLFPIISILSTGGGSHFCCSSRTLVHIQQMDRWSCGFRNFQMLLSSLISVLPPDHSYFGPSRPYTPGYCSIPSLVEIQQHFQDSWAAGFDPKGAIHYGGRLVGKGVWIGAVEVAACAAYLGLDATVVQFLQCAASRELLGPVCGAYFTQHKSAFDGSSSMKIVQQLLNSCDHQGEPGAPNSSAVSPPVLPLYLQWKGHSVTVVGVEYSRSQPGAKAAAALSSPTHLLVFDPRKQGSTLRQALESTKDPWKPYRLPLSQLQSRDTQIVLATTQSLSISDQEARKGPVRVVSAAQAEVERSLLSAKYKSGR